MFVDSNDDDKESLNEILEYKNRLILTKSIDWLNNKIERLYLISAIVIANYTRSG